MKCKIIFNDGFECIKEIAEDFENTIIEQMGRQQNKRLYTYGIEFKEVKHIEVLGNG